MKTLYIGDIHGRIDIIRYVKENFKNYKKVFVGDYLDSFDRTRAEQMECLNLIFEMIEIGDTISLMGNHELSYLLPREMKCSGYSNNFYNQLRWHNLLSKMWKYFLHYHIWDSENKILVTHAGITKYIWDEFSLTVDNLEDKFFEWRRDQYYTAPLYWIGKSRGGIDKVGGPLWCDWNEDFTPVSAITQIFGHTGHVDMHLDLTYGIRTRGVGHTNYNLDCLGRKVEFLEFDSETKQFNIITVDKEIKL